VIGSAHYGLSRNLFSTKQLSGNHFDTTDRHTLNYSHATILPVQLNSLNADPFNFDCINSYSPMENGCLILPINYKATTTMRLYFPKYL
jgi:hypothetical protein